MSEVEVDDKRQSQKYNRPMSKKTAKSLVQIQGRENYNEKSKTKN